MGLRSHTTLNLERAWRTSVLFAFVSCSFAGQLPRPEQQPATPANAAGRNVGGDSRPAQDIIYRNGLLTIQARDLTVSQLLTEIAAATSIKIDLPPDAANDKLPSIQLGPGPARGILTSLLSDLNFDFVIQSGDRDPERLQSVVLMTRERKMPGNGSESVQLSSRSPYVGAGTASATTPEETPVPDHVAKPSDQDASDTAPAAQAPPPAIPSNGTEVRPVPQANSQRPGALSPPQTLNTQSMNQQLQQMYQDRMQMIQQSRQAAASATPK